MRKVTFCLFLSIFLSIYKFSTAEVNIQKDGLVNSSFVFDARKTRYPTGDALFARGNPVLDVKRTNDATHWGTYVNSTGVIVRDSSNTSRTCYGYWNETGYQSIGYPAIYKECLSQNIIWASEDLTDVHWTKTNVTIGQNQTAAPDGQTSADSVTANETNGTCIQTVAGTAQRSAGVFLKRKTGTGDVFVTYDNGETYTNITSNLASALLDDEWIRPYSDGFSPATSGGLGIKIATAADSVYMWGGQFEGRAILTSYIPTTTAVRYTRNSDSLYFNGTSNFLGSDTGSILFRCRLLRRPNQQEDGAQYSNYVTITIDASNNWYIMHSSNTNNYLFFGSENATGSTISSFGNLSTYSKYQPVTLIAAYSNTGGFYEGQNGWLQVSYVNGTRTSQSQTNYVPVGTIPNIVMLSAYHDFILESIVISPVAWNLEQVAKMNERYNN
jgi:hypothetical protein